MLTNFFHNNMDKRVWLMCDKICQKSLRKNYVKQKPKSLSFVMFKKHELMLVCSKNNMFIQPRYTYISTYF